MKILLSTISVLVLFTHCWADSKVTKKGTLSDKNKTFLLNLSRQTLYWYLKDGSLPKPEKSTLDSYLLKNQTCFVTLDKKGLGLRGCMGFGQKSTLYENVIDRTIAAATKDPRFNKVTYNELKDIKLEISVLTEAKPLHFSSSKDLLAKLRPGIDGVILYTQFGASTYLPQVWDHFKTKEEFLSNLCRKHGAPMDTWEKNSKNVKVETYQAIVFGEESYGRRVVGPKGGVVGKNGAVIFGTENPLKKGTQLNPGTIVTAESDVKDLD